MRYGFQLEYGKGELTGYLRFTRAESQTYAGNYETPNLRLLFAKILAQGLQ